MCVRCSLCVFVWHYKRIKACSQPRVQTGPFLIVPSVCPIGWWGINLPLCCYMCLCQTVWARLSKNSNIFFPYFKLPGTHLPPSLPLSLPLSLPPSTQLRPEKPLPLSPAVASAAILLIAFRLCILRWLALSFEVWPTVSSQKTAPVPASRHSQHQQQSDF